ncbi:hypothetical protein EG829_23610 [bacterium]|nr:hypothetical protein [bacterium]
MNPLGSSNLPPGVTMRDIEGEIQRCDFCGERSEELDDNLMCDACRELEQTDIDEDDIEMDEPTQEDAE